MLSARSFQIGPVYRVGRVGSGGPCCLVRPVRFSRADSAESSHRAGNVGRIYRVVGWKSVGFIDPLGSGWSGGSNQLDRVDRSVGVGQSGRSERIGRISRSVKLSLRTEQGYTEALPRRTVQGYAKGSSAPHSLAVHYVFLGDRNQKCPKKRSSRPFIRRKSATLRAHLNHIFVHTILPFLLGYLLLLGFDFVRCRIIVTS